VGGRGVPCLTKKIKGRKDDRKFRTVFELLQRVYDEPVRKDGNIDRRKKENITVE
jgi:hypothetical protein